MDDTLLAHIFYAITTLNDDTPPCFIATNHQKTITEDDIIMVREAGFEIKTLEGGLFLHKKTVVHFTTVYLHGIAYTFCKEKVHLDQDAHMVLLSVVDRATDDIARATCPGCIEQIQKDLNHAKQNAGLLDTTEGEKP